MEISEDTAEKRLSPICRTRCNTWHAGLALQSGVSNSVNHSPALPESPPTASDHSSVVKKTPARRNAWGTASYADLIATAIESSPDRRLTLSQIYDWIVSNVQYFSDKADNNSSAGWKNSIRHNLSLHRRFVRVPHSDGKSAWWTIGSGHADGSATSGARWSRSSATTRHRADTMDTRSYALQRQRRSGRKAAAADSADRRSHDKKPCLEVNTTTAPAAPTTFSFANNCDGLYVSTDDVFVSSTSGSVDSPTLGCYFTDVAIAGGSRSCLNSDSFLSATTAFNNDSACIENLAPIELTSSSFGPKRVSVPPSFGCPPSSLLCEDDSSNAMITQLDAWNHSDDGESNLFANDSTVVCPMIDDRLSELFSDVAMSHDESCSVSLLPDQSETDILQSDAGSFCGAISNELGPSGEAATSILAALSSVLPSLRRGSDAPPPSPQSNASDTDDPAPHILTARILGHLSDVKNDDSTDLSADDASVQTYSASGWSDSLFPYKTDDVSNLSDMDMDH